MERRGDAFHEVIRNNAGITRQDRHILCHADGTSSDADVGRPWGEEPLHYPWGWSGSESVRRPDRLLPCARNGSRPIDLFLRREGTAIWGKRIPRSVAVGSAERQCGSQRVGRSEEHTSELQSRGLIP